MRVELDEPLAITEVFRTGRSARVDDQDYSTAQGPIADYLRRVGNRSAVASPIIVEGRLWGAVVASTKRELLPPDTEERMANFTELVGIVIANAESRAELTASRARVVAAADEARRRIQRDLHDGAQQRLVSTMMALKLARQELGDATGPAVELVDEALEHAEGASGELRELAHGILPAALSRGGLRAGIDALVSRVHLPVSVDVTAEALPAALEATAYFIVAEALTNAVRHAARRQRADRGVGPRRRAVARGPRRRSRRRAERRRLGADRAARPGRRRERGAARREPSGRGDRGRRDAAHPGLRKGGGTPGARSGPRATPRRRIAAPATTIAASEDGDRGRHGLTSSRSGPRSSARSDRPIATSARVPMATP